MVTKVYLHGDFMVTTVHLHDNYMMTRVYPHGDYKVQFCRTLRLVVELRASTDCTEINDHCDISIDQQLARRAPAACMLLCAVMEDTQSLRPSMMLQQTHKAATA